MLRACVFSNTSTKTSACIMCKDSLLSLKQNSLCSLCKKRVVPVGLHYTDVQTCNIAYESETLSREVWFLCCMGKSLFILEQESRSCQPVFHISVCKMSVYTMYNIKIMHAFGCRQIFLCIVSSQQTITASVQCYPIYKIH